tara:strand:+ start:250 stop:402 length:153 start_codon:yes stop_codon:yes gene_type:complete
MNMKDKEKRVRKCHTFNPTVYEQYQKLCEKKDAVPSRAIERFMVRQINAI